ncbi:hypothetical protein [Tunturiibacter psychrotolerans]|uniref:hypothetical protein n=1 Tax=Tunturiibacter psychrotolerans TaxID=3069686 RepID=UPI003D1FF87C
MPQRLLNSHKHFCFHTPRANVHQHPDLYRCARGAAHEKLLASTTEHVKDHHVGPTRIYAPAPAVFPQGYAHPPDTIIPEIDCPACNDLAEAMSKDFAPCTANIHFDMAKQAGLVDEAGNVSCPACDGPTTLVPGQKLAEIHAKLCTDETIHYPEMRKAGTVSEAGYQTWKATLTHSELNGYYERTPVLNLMAKFTHDETALMQTDIVAFNALMNQRLRERAEVALLHQVPYRHKTTSPSVSL